MQGLIHIYCGEGKGKTTAAVGLGVRACGSGKKVLMLQFLKGNSSGERNLLQDLPHFTLIPGPESIKFTFQMTPQELAQTAELCEQQLRNAAALAAEGDFDLLILDEVFGAVSCGLLQNSMLIDLIQNKPQKLELVFTGRDPDPKIVELADYVSEIRKIKHPYDRKIPARKGIEF